jgi:hypothetical protein
MANAFIINMLGKSPVNDSISSSKASVVFDADGVSIGGSTFVITSSGAWTSAKVNLFGSGTGWYSYTPTSGNSGATIAVSCDSNAGPGGRESKITFTVGLATVDVFVYQDPPPL